MTQVKQTPFSPLGLNMLPLIRFPRRFFITKSLWRSRRNWSRFTVTAKLGLRCHSRNFMLSKLARPDFHVLCPQNSIIYGANEPYDVWVELKTMSIYDKTLPSPTPKRLWCWRYISQPQSIFFLILQRTYAFDTDVNRRKWHKKSEEIPKIHREAKEMYNSPQISLNLTSLFRSRRSISFSRIAFLELNLNPDAYLYSLIAYPFQVKEKFSKFPFRTWYLV